MRYLIEQSEQTPHPVCFLDEGVLTLFSNLYYFFLFKMFVLGATAPINISLVMHDIITIKLFWNPPIFVVGNITLYEIECNKNNINSSNNNNNISIAPIKTRQQEKVIVFEIEKKYKCRVRLILLQYLPVKGTELKMCKNI